MELENYEQQVCCICFCEAAGSTQDCGHLYCLECLMDLAATQPFCCFSCGSNSSVFVIARTDTTFEYVTISIENGDVNVEICAEPVPQAPESIKCDICFEEEVDIIDVECECNIKICEQCAIKWTVNDAEFFYSCMTCQRRFEFYVVNEVTRMFPWIEPVFDAEGDAVDEQDIIDIDEQLNDVIEAIEAVENADGNGDVLNFAVENFVNEYNFNDFDDIDIVDLTDGASESDRQTELEEETDIEEEEETDIEEEETDIEEVAANEEDTESEVDTESEEDTESEDGYDESENNEETDDNQEDSDNEFDDESDNLDYDYYGDDEYDHEDYNSYDEFDEYEEGDTDFSEDELESLDEEEFLQSLRAMSTSQNFETYQERADNQRRERELRYMHREARQIIAEVDEYLPAEETVDLDIYSDNYD